MTPAGSGPRVVDTWFCSHPRQLPTLAWLDPSALQTRSPGQGSGSKGRVRPGTSRSVVTEEVRDEGGGVHLLLLRKDTREPTVGLCVFET